MFLNEYVRLRVGRLGASVFPAGRCVYRGSALGGVERRLARHRRRRKTLHGHIDDFLRHAHLDGVRVVFTRRRLECEWNRRVLRQPGARVVAPRLGARDCRCPAHLVYLGPVDGEEGHGIL
ncbi:hypothetical protein HRbin11_00872 [bacterium HR11]|nr:hypothetical protein HRbin11_00872 [bacterium HR11]